MKKKPDGEKMKKKRKEKKAESESEGDDSDDSVGTAGLVGAHDECLKVL